MFNEKTLYNYQFKQTNKHKVKTIKSKTYRFRKGKTFVFIISLHSEIRSK